MPDLAGIRRRATRLLAVPCLLVLSITPAPGGHAGAALPLSLLPGAGLVDLPLGWATYLGGSGGEQASSVTVDGQGNIDVTGDTESRNFPATPGAVQSHRRGCGCSSEAFVASYDGEGRLRWATYLGGTDGADGTAIAVDRQDNLYVAGDTYSNDFPVTPGAAQPHHHSGPYHDGNAFVTSFTSGGALRWSTYLGAGHDWGDGIAVDRQGNIYVIGTTGALDFPVTPGPAPLPPPGAPHSQSFPRTLHTLAYPFLAAWNHLGGIPTLGLPLSEPFELAGEQVQVTERALLVRSGAAIGLAPLGRLLSLAHRSAPLPSVAESATQRYFPSTGHTLSGPFLSYWLTHQGSSVLGAPITEPDQEERGPALVQWFENGRLEYYPGQRDPRSQVQSGRVGYEFVHRLGLL